jgi:hypothetical protein
VQMYLLSRASVKNCKGILAPKVGNRCARYDGTAPTFLRLIECSRQQIYTWIRRDSLGPYAVELRISTADVIFQQKNNSPSTVWKL